LTTTREEGIKTGALKLGAIMTITTYKKETVDKPFIPDKGRSEKRASREARTKFWREKRVTKQAKTVQIYRGG